MVLESALRGRWRVHSPLAGAGQRRRVLGAALKTSDESQNPVYVSVGSGISLTSGGNVYLEFCLHTFYLFLGIEIVKLMSKYRIPEPTRQADIISREYLRFVWKC